MTRDSIMALILTLILGLGIGAQLGAKKICNESGLRHKHLTCVQEQEEK